MTLDDKKSSEKRSDNAAIGKDDSIFHVILKQFHGVLSVLLITLNTLFAFGPLMFFTFLKLFVPISGWRKLCGKIINGIAVTWISINNFNIWWTNRIVWDVRGLDKLSMNQWYLVVSNHQTWIDIVVLQKIFNRKIPFLKFFLKKELIWVPFLGVAWWALDYPFMKRYSASFIKKHPHLKGKDIEITRNVCKKFEEIPVSIMNFVEGTRFTKEKHDRQQSPFAHLLKPKAGGIGFVLSTMGDQLSNILNVTIMYPEGNTSFWGFLCGNIKHIKVVVETLPISEEILGDYINDKDYQERFQHWLNALWHEKDKLMGA